MSYTKLGTDMEFDRTAKAGFMSVSVVSHKTKADGLRYRERILRMSKVELLCEFQAVTRKSAGKELSVETARDYKLLMECLLQVSENEVFISELKKALSVLDLELARLEN